MRNIYLVRHGQPDFPNGKHMCIGLTDLPLSKLGRLQAVLLGAEFDGRQVTVFSSPLQRARQTAEALGRPVTILDGFRELDMGQWDGLTFDEIRCRFPELYAARATDRTLPFLDAEDHREGLQRFTDAIRQALSMCSGDLVIVTHSGVMELFLNTREKAPYCSVTHIAEDQNTFSLRGFGAIPHPSLNRDLCERLLSAAHTPQNVVQHCRSVAEKAYHLACPLLEAGYRLDMRLIEIGALLHDIARTEDLHAQRGAWYLGKLGYPEIAGLILSHCDCSAAQLREESIIFLADKMKVGTATVTIQERFAKSRRKCRTEEEIHYHQTRYAAALEILRMYNDAVPDNRDENPK